MKTKIIILTLLMVLVTGCNLFNQPVEHNIYVDEPSNQELKVGAWNVQVFGKTKLAKPGFKYNFEEVLNTFDLLAIQEIRDASGGVVSYLESINGFDSVCSERLGRSTSKEQYCVLYDNNFVLKDSRVFPDSNDKFEREPFIAYFEGAGKDFIVLVVHVKPSQATAEIKELQGVIDYAKRLYFDEDFILMGDLNADCSYYDEGLHYLRDYEWYVGNDVDTTVSKNTCTYDRIISSMDLGDANAYRFDMVHELRGMSVKEVSDHYPVYTKINT